MTCIRCGDRPGACLACSTNEFFPDSDLVAYVADVYGAAMAARCDEIFSLDPESESGFGRSVRRSLSREIARKAEISSESFDRAARGHFDGRSLAAQKGPTMPDAWNDAAVTDAMCETLQQLQIVRDFDFDSAYRITFGGVDHRYVRRCTSHLAGRALALEVWRDRMHGTVAERDAFDRRAAADAYLADELGLPLRGADA